jgi:hypothetical protein
MDFHSSLFSAILMLAILVMLTGFSALVVALMIWMWGSDE